MEELHHEEDVHDHGFYTCTFFKYMQEAYKEHFSMARDLAVDAQQQHKAICQRFGLRTNGVLLLMLLTFGLLLGNGTSVKLSSMK